MDIVKENRAKIIIVLALAVFFTLASFYALFALKQIPALAGVALCGLLSMLLFFKLLNPDYLEITPEGIRWVSPMADTFIARDNISQIGIKLIVSTTNYGTFKRPRNRTTTTKQVGVLLHDVDAYIRTENIKKQSILAEMLISILKMFARAGHLNLREHLLESRQKYGYDILLPNTLGAERLIEKLKVYYPDKVMR